MTRRVVLPTFDEELIILSSSSTTNHSASDIRYGLIEII
jgi:hypothetical protein